MTNKDMMAVCERQIARLEKQMNSMNIGDTGFWDMEQSLQAYLTQYRSFVDVEEKLRLAQEKQSWDKELSMKKHEADTKARTFDEQMNQKKFEADRSDRKFDEKMTSGKFEADTKARTAEQKLAERKVGNEETRANTEHIADMARLDLETRRFNLDHDVRLKQCELADSEFELKIGQSDFNKSEVNRRFELDREIQKGRLELDKQKSQFDADKYVEEYQIRKAQMKQEKVTTALTMVGGVVKNLAIGVAVPIVLQGAGMAFTGSMVSNLLQFEQTGVATSMATKALVNTTLFKKFI